MSQLERSKKNQLVAFLIATILLFLGLSWKLGFLSANRTQAYRIYLTDASGLVQDNSVKIAGVVVGRIAKLRVDHDRALLELELDADTKLHAGATGLVRAKSLLGEKYLELLPGDAAAEILPPGSELALGKSSYDVDQLLNALEPVMQQDGGLSAQLEPWLRELERLHAKLEEPGSREKLAQSAASLEQAVADTAAIAASLRRILDAHEDEVGQIIANLAKISGDPQLAQIIRETHVVSSALARDMPGLLTTSSQTLTDLQRISSQMAILLDESRVQRLGAALDTVAKTASPLAESVVIAHAMAQDLDAFRRGMSGSASTLLQAGKHSAALLDGLQQLVARLVRIDELTIRRFIQEEGIRVKLGTSRDVKDRIEELREQ